MIIRESQHRRTPLHTRRGEGTDIAAPPGNVRDRTTGDERWMALKILLLCIALAGGAACDKKNKSLRVPVNNSPAFGRTPHIADAPLVVRDAARGVVRVALANDIGTGFFVSATGLMVTVRTVLSSENCAAFGCQVQIGRDYQFGSAPETRSVVGRVVFEDREAGIALTQLWGDDGKPFATPFFVPLAAGELPRSGESVVAIGHPYGGLKRYFPGRVIERTGRLEIAGDYLPLDGAFGGPVLDDRGQARAVSLAGSNDLGNVSRNGDVVARGIARGFSQNLLAAVADFTQNSVAPSRGGAPSTRWDLLTDAEVERRIKWFANSDVAPGPGFGSPHAIVGYLRRKCLKTLENEPYRGRAGPSGDHPIADGCLPWLEWLAKASPRDREDRLLAPSGSREDEARTLAGRVARVVADRDPLTAIKIVYFAAAINLASSDEAVHAAEHFMAQHSLELSLPAAAFLLARWTGSSDTFRGGSLVEFLMSSSRKPEAVFYSSELTEALLRSYRERNRPSRDWLTTTFNEMAQSPQMSLRGLIRLEAIAYDASHSQDQ